MTIEQATILAAVLGALVTALVTRLDDIINLFKSSVRLVSGDWEGFSYLHPAGTDTTWDETTSKPDLKFVISLSQTGQKVRGTFTITEAPDFVVVRKLKFSGKVINDYLVYETNGFNRDEFRFSTALLNIRPSGKTLEGFFVANGGAKDHYRVFVGFTTMKKR